MACLRDTHASVTLHLTWGCGGVLYRPEGYTSNSTRVMHERVLDYASSLRGARQFWFKQRSRLIAMVDTLGMPTVFFTHSAADGQWPELACLICADNPGSSSSRSSAVSENPVIVDWLFYKASVSLSKHSTWATLELQTIGSDLVATPWKYTRA